MVNIGFRFYKIIILLRFDHHVSRPCHVAVCVSFNCHTKIRKLRDEMLKFSVITAIEQDR